MFRAYRYRLRLTRAQYARLSKVLEQQRQLYNAALQERRDAWRLARAAITKLEQYRSLTAIRADDPLGYAAVPVALSRWTLERVDEAMKGFFARVKRRERSGFPRFRSASRWATLGFTEINGIRFDRGRLFIKGIDGGLRLKLHRPLPAEADLRTATLTFDGHHWHVSLVVDLPERPRHRRAARAVGIDLGIEHLMTLSTGEAIANLRPRATAESELRHRQSQLARCRRGSKRRQKVRARLARLQRRIVNRRRTYLHTVTKRVVQRFGVIAVEKLATRNLTRSAGGTRNTPGVNVKAKAGLNRALLDASPAMVIDLLRQKAESAAGVLIAVDPRHTSQDCSNCRRRVPKPLAQRVHRCGCGLILHRDVNAARNILARAVVRPADANAGGTSPSVVRESGRSPERLPARRACARSSANEFAEEPRNEPQVATYGQYPAACPSLRNSDAPQ